MAYKAGDRLQLGLCVQSCCKDGASICNGQGAPGQVVDLEGNLAGACVPHLGAQFIARHHDIGKPHLRHMGCLQSVCQLALSQPCFEHVTLVCRH